MPPFSHRWESDVKWVSKELSPQLEEREEFFLSKKKSSKALNDEIILPRGNWERLQKEWQKMDDYAKSIPSKEAVGSVSWQRQKKEDKYKDKDEDEKDKEMVRNSKSNNMRHAAPHFDKQEWGWGAKHSPLLQRSHLLLGLSLELKALSQKVKAKCLFD